MGLYIRNLLVSDMTDLGNVYKKVARELTNKNRKWAGIPEGGYWCNTKNGMLEYAKAHGGEELCMLG